MSNSYEFYSELLNHVETLQTTINQIRELLKNKIEEAQSQNSQSRE